MNQRVTSTSQPALFHEDINDAIRAAVQVLGGTKAVGALLWPEKRVDDARNQLNECMNPDRPAKLSPEQLLFIARSAREAGFHGLKHYIDDECGYERSAPIEPEDELTRLLREYIDIENRRASIGPKIEAARAKLGRV